MLPESCLQRPNRFHMDNGTPVVRYEDEQGNRRALNYGHTKYFVKRTPTSTFKNVHKFCHELEKCTTEYKEEFSFNSMETNAKKQLSLGIGTILEALPINASFRSSMQTNIRCTYNSGEKHYLQKYSKEKLDVTFAEPTNVRIIKEVVEVRHCCHLFVNGKPDKRGQEISLIFVNECYETY
eukprot:m.747270 g.747270  ORF g.747270 m.747270 type:complete len:181 (-) comp23143_c1_seq17:3280-3822(-)